MKILSKPLVSIVERPAYNERNRQLPHVLEGSDVLNQLTTIDPITGTHTDVLALLDTLSRDPAKSRLVSMVTKEIPSLSSIDAPDEVKFDMLKTRLMTGSPSEDASFAEYLAEVAKPLYTSQVDTSVVPSVDTSFDTSVEPNE